MAADRIRENRQKYWNGGSEKEGGNSYVRSALEFIIPRRIEQNSMLNHTEV